MFLAVFPVVSTAVEIPFSDAVVGPAVSQQFDPSIGASDDGYLVVWSDQRASLETYAARVARDGEVLDPTGIRLGPGAACERSVVWNGNEWVVLWSTGDGRLWESRLSRAGEVRVHGRLVAEGIQSPSVLQAGVYTVVGYASSARPYEPRGMFLDGQGNIAADVRLASGDETQAPRIAWNGTHLLAVWTKGPAPDRTVIEGVRFTRDGLVDPVARPLVSEGSPVDPRVASDGEGFMLLTRDNTSRGDSARALSAGLTTVRQQPTALASGGIDATTLLWDGTQYVVVAEDGTGINAVRMDPDGSLRDEVPAVVQAFEGGSAAASPVAAADGSRLFVAWTGRSGPDGSNYDIIGTTLTSALEPGDAALVSASAAAQTNPLLAAGSDRILTLWNEEAKLYARRVTQAGEPIDAAPILLSSAASESSATFDGSTFLVVWVDTARAFLKTLAIPLAGPIDPRLARERALEEPGVTAIASSDGATIVGWVDRGALALARIDATAQMIDTVPLTLAESDVATLSITGGEGFLVTWGRSVSGEAQTARPAAVHGAVLSRDLAVSSFPGFEIVDTDAEEGAPSAAWNGSEWLVVWERSDRSRADVRARHITVEGWPIEGTARDAGFLIADDADTPRLVWDGARYSLAWRSAAGRSFLATEADPSHGVFDLHDAGDSVAGSYSLVSTGTGRVARAWSRIAHGAAYGGVARAFMELPSPASRRRSVR